MRYAIIILLMLLPGIAAAQISGGSVRIGVLTDMSGPYADNTGSGSVLAAKMAIEDFGGKVAGAPIELVSADHLNKPDIGLARARQWYDQDGVDAIIDVPGSAIALGVQQLAREKNRVLIVSGGGTSDLTGASCSPTTVHWTWDTYAFGNGLATEMVKRGYASWFFLSVDYALGQALERDAANAVKRAGGSVVGSVRHPINTADFSQFVLQAQASKAKIVALANGGADTANAIKQAHEFGLVDGGQQLAALAMQIHDTRALGLGLTQGMIVTQAFYWNRDEPSREWSERFLKAQGKMPTDFQAGLYSAVTHYLRAIAALGGDEAKSVVAKMKELPVRDFFASNGVVRQDGRMVHDIYLLETKKPSESNRDWDFYKVLAAIPGEVAFRPLKDGGCPER
ncbi:MULTISPECIES: ABC transporter substrate-binding protein [unclassified Bradyrhizobium]|uniref:ABC transporter substrate-binding protein n=1 Tax=unclassified Bradyrhizobium TaxID=2631580 RepID=UPI00230651E3|nr:MULTISPECIES: ABC transporter substrate-binding protein [unclassified Bradyrhizobium]MDA9451191.1 ABC transporter permease [Bradyrhizobium sp. CCBAU 21360]MDA9457570.1 ABC transporter permease [Bradyrhizobium sp. CCBAU 21359]